MFITGAAGGIGRKLVGAFLSTGASVTAADVSDHGLRDLAAAHADDGLRIRALDLGNSSDCQGAIVEAGQVDILINNAGASMGLIRDDHLDRLVNLDEVTPELWDHFVATNLSGPWYLTKACVPAMRTRGWGRIINIGSEVLARGAGNFSPYVAAKGAQNGWTRSMATELAPDGITVNMISPGWIPVERHAGAHPEQIESYRSVVPMGRMGLPEDMAGAITFLASNASNFITGQNIHVNGGVTTH